MCCKFLILILLNFLQCGCLKSAPYTPELIESFQRRPENLRLNFQTDNGHQVAFYLPPLDAPDQPPEKIAILYPGIYSVALDWLQFIDLREDPTAAYLLIDYPGRGFSEGVMRPEENYRNTEGALNALAVHFGQERLDADLNLMAHSFGSGAALQFAVRHQVQRIGLVAPFNTLRQAIAKKSLLLSILMPDKIDNRELIRILLASDQPPLITIYHGGLDTSLPISMGRELAALAPDRILFYEFPEDDHVNILSRRRNLIFRSLNGPADRNPRFRKIFQ